MEKTYQPEALEADLYAHWEQVGTSPPAVSARPTAL